MEEKIVLSNGLVIIREGTLVRLDIGCTLDIETELAISNMLFELLRSMMK